MHNCLEINDCQELSLLSATWCLDEDWDLCELRIWRAVRALKQRGI